MLTQLFADFNKITQPEPLKKGKGNKRDKKEEQQQIDMGDNTNELIVRPTKKYKLMTHLHLHNNINNNNNIEINNYSNINNCNNINKHIL